MKRNYTKILAGFSVLLVVLVLADTSAAQRRKARGKKYSKAQVENVIKRVETRADNFVDNFDESLDNSRLDGSEREDDLMKRARELENETDELEREFDKSDRWIDNKAQVRTVLDLASDINRTMKNRKLGKKTESNWARLRYELNTLAKIYKLPAVGSSAYR